jgi:hypothetical protein
MGLVSSSVWYVYARDYNDSWTDAVASTLHQTDNTRYQLARFKHEVYAYALYYTNKHKAIYLYQGRTRYAKAWFSTPNNMKIEFASPEHQELFHKCREDPTGSRSRLEEPFFLRYEYNTDLNMYIRKQ